MTRHLLEACIDQRSSFCKDLADAWVLKSILKILCPFDDGPRRYHRTLGQNDNVRYTV
jgi:hypothetical protein